MKVEVAVLGSPSLIIIIIIMYIYHALIYALMVSVDVQQH